MLLLTKADLLTEAQLAFVQAQTRGKCDGDLPVFFYSVHPALAPLKEELVEQLLMSLRRGCGEATGRSLPPTLGGGGAGSRDNLEEGPPVTE